MTELEFKALAAQGYNRIPLIAESFADLETPLSLYLKLARAQGSGATPFCSNRWSAASASAAIRSSACRRARRSRRHRRPGKHRIEVVTDGAVVREERGDPLAFIEKHFARFKVALRPGMPRFCGGLAGYFGYDTVRCSRRSLRRPSPTTSACPTSCCCRQKNWR